jgi:hypothetical protein
MKSNLSLGFHLSGYIEVDLSVEGLRDVACYLAIMKFEGHFS